MKRLKFNGALVFQDLRNAMNDKYKSLVVAVLCATFSIDALATTLTTCDPNTDPLGCDCTEGAGFRCDIIDLADYSSLADPQEWSTADWITSVWDPGINAHRVVANLDLAPGKGLFVPLQNGGEWASSSEMNDWLSEVLQVPLDPTGILEPFVYTQIGKAYVINHGAATLLSGTGIFWQDLISDSNGQITINDYFEPATVGQVQCNQDGGNTDTYVEVGDHHSIEQTNGICYTTYSCNDLPTAQGCPVGLYVTTTQGTMSTKVKSVSGYDYDWYYEELPIEYADCDPSGFCTINENLIDLLNAPAGRVRIFRLVSNLIGIHDFYQGGSEVVQITDEAFNSSHLYTKFSDSVWHGGSSPVLAFDSICSTVISEHVYESLELFLLTYVGGVTLPTCD